MRFIPLATIAVAIIATSAPSHATTTDYGIDIYMSAPTVQGSAVTVSEVTTESFNAFSTGTCPSNLAIGTISSGDCTVSAVGTYGGASATDATPTTGGPGSNYASTSGPSSSITIDLTEPARYLGLWWSAGSSSNTVEFYSDGVRVAQMTTGGLMDLLSGPSVSSEGGSTYNTADYFGNPRDFALASAEPFLYLNLYGTGGASFDQVVLSGGGFEFDNISVSDLEQTPGSGEVGVEFIPGENEPTVTDDEDSLAETGFDANSVIALGVVAIAVGAFALRRRIVRRT